MEEMAFLPEQHLDGRSEDKEEDGSAKASCLPLVNNPPLQPVSKNGIITGRNVKLIVSVYALLFQLCCRWINKMIFVSFAFSQGHFPQMENIAAFKHVSTSPTRSTCGVPERGSYCQSASSRSELMTCYQAFCVQECPYRSTTPPHAPLLLSAHRYIKLATPLSHFKKPSCQPPEHRQNKTKQWIIRFGTERQHLLCFWRSMLTYLNCIPPGEAV